MFYIYGYYEKDYAEPFYIGKGHGNRAWDHLQLSKGDQSTPFYKKLASLNWQAEIIILEEGMTENEAFEFEVQSIAFFGRKDQGAGPLLNLTDGGEGATGFKHSEATKEICRRAREQQPSPSESWRNRQSDLMKGNTYGRAKRMPIRALFCGMEVKRYDFVRQVEEDGYAQGNVSAVLNKRHRSAYGFQWETL